MVFLSYPLYIRVTSHSLKGYTIKGHRVNFMDSLRIYCRGGYGGHGLPKLGGIGGKGGAVYVVGGDKTMKLRSVEDANPKKRFIAGQGGNSHVHRLQGELGESVEVRVPLGISVVTEAGKCLGDINKPGQSIRVASGGDGARAGNGFEPQPGERAQVKLDLKLVADVGLVGFPNAGKSTLVNGVSRARPRIASYPFTTLHPNIGMMEYADSRQISMADLPGLIEGAHYNAGMGHKFLKHVERTKLLLYMVDVGGFQLANNHPVRSAFHMVVLLNRELELYDPALLTKPAVLCINKMDGDGAPELCARLRADLRHWQQTGRHDDIGKYEIPKQLQQFDDIVEISAKYGTNLDYLKDKLRELLDFYADLKTDFSHQLDAVYADKYLKGYKFDVT